MKKIISLLFLTIFTKLAAAEHDLPDSTVAEVSTETTKSPVLSRPEHLQFLDRLVPKLSTPKSIKQELELTGRIERLYGTYLRENPAFYRLIEPLIEIKPDSDGYHMSFVMSDFRLSFLKMLAEKIKPPVLTYADALSRLEPTSVPERYKFFMFRISSIAPIQTALLSAIWASIFTIDDSQFRTLNNLLDFLDKYPTLKEAQAGTTLQQMFQNSSGPERCECFIFRISSISSIKIALLSTILTNIFTIDNGQFRILNNVLDFLDKYPKKLQETYVNTALQQMFQNNNWSKEHWDKFITTLKITLPTCDLTVRGGS